MAEDVLSGFRLGQIIGVAIWIFLTIVTVKYLKKRKKKKEKENV